MYWLFHCVELISHISLGERALIEAQWVHLTDPVFQCHEKIQTEMKKHNLTLEEATKRGTVRGRCDTRTLEFDHYTLHRCVCNYSHPQFDMFYLLWKAYKNGILPYPGAAFDQPCWVFEVLDLFDTMHREAEDRERARAETKRGAQHGKPN